MKSVFQSLTTAALILLSGYWAATAQTVSRPPKNIILMICDGWGYNHILATDYYQFGLSNAQSYHAFPFHSAVSTFSAEGRYEPDSAWTSFDYVKKRPTDSGAAATAFATGKITYNGAIGIGPDHNPLENIVQRAEKRGKATGVVTSVPWSHATPAAMAAHAASRDSYTAIAKEMVYRSGLEVISCGKLELKSKTLPANPWKPFNRISTPVSS